jgi:hypothetical protein
METNTRQYEFSHGKKPRGKGYWAFEVTGTDDKHVYIESDPLWAYGTLAAAKKQAIRSFKNVYSAVTRIIEIKVLP